MPTPAQVTLTVTLFRPVSSTEKARYVEATTTLAPHPVVSLVDRDGLPTLVCLDAVDLELTVASAVPKESYLPLAVSFHQHAGGSSDKSGGINFERLTPAPATGKLHFRNKRVVRGAEGQYEFFVLIQRASDGAIGLIDPGIVNEPT